MRPLLALLVALSAALPAMARPAAAQASLDAGLLSTFRFRFIGPATMSGRITDVAVLESDPTTMYVASATGGVWKTTDNAITMRRCSMKSACTPSARSASSRATRTSSGSAPARRPTARAPGGATASTSRSTAAARGRTWVSPRAGTSRASSRIRRTATSSTSPCPASCGGRARSAGCTGRATAGRAGSSCSRATRTPASPRSRWIRPTRTCSTPPRISGGGRRSASSAAGPAPRSGSRRTPARRGAKLTTGLPSGHLGPHRHLRLSQESERRLRLDRAGPALHVEHLVRAAARGHLPLRRQGRDVAPHGRLQSAPRVLEQAARRPERRAPALSGAVLGVATTAATRGASRGRRCTATTASSG